MEAAAEYDLGYAIVRIHPGKRSEEERKAILIESAKEFWKALQKAEAAKGKTLVVGSDGCIVSVSKPCDDVCGGSIQRNAGRQG